MTEIRYFLSDALRKSGDLHSADAKLAKMLAGYDIREPIAILPDFTDSNSLPIGTTATMGSDKPINPALIGMDIGCGYQFISADMKSKRFFRKGKLRENATESVVNGISNAIYGNGRANHIDLGTIGKGNHFIDMFIVDETYDSQACAENGLDSDKTYFLIHSGSREKGFEVNSEFSERFRNLNGDTKIFNSEYLTAFGEAKNYARLNRDILRKIVAEALNQMHGEEIPTSVLFDKPHNDIQSVEGDEGLYKLKKGTSDLRTGEIFVIPGTAVDPAYAVIGLPGLEKSHFTINHGCGRRYTREQTLNRYQRTNLEKDFAGVILNVDAKKMVEEHPNAYKPIEEIIAAAEEHGLVRKIARLKPLGVIVERRK